MNIQSEKPVLSVKDLNVIYTHQGKASPLFKKSISLQVYPQQLFVVTGPSGTGKSSILSAILGLVNYTGEIKATERYNFLTIQNALDQKETLQYNFNKYYQMFGVKIDWSLLKAYVNVHQNVTWDQRVDTLSFGTKRRFALYRVLYDRNAELFLLDEPTTGFDQANTENFIRLISEQRLKNKKSYFIITHDHTVLKHATAILLLSEHCLTLRQEQYRGFFKFRPALKHDFEKLCATLKIPCNLVFSYGSTNYVIYEVYNNKAYDRVNAVLNYDEKWRAQSLNKKAGEPLDKFIKFYNL